MLGAHAGALGDQEPDRVRHRERRALGELARRRPTTSARIARVSTSKHIAPSAAVSSGEQK